MPALYTSRREALQHGGILRLQALLQFYVMRHSVEAKKAAAISKHSRLAFGWEELHLSPNHSLNGRGECTRRLIRG
jgi:hypothetical protein